ncbi:hypothetical protein CBI31_01975 [Polynucleobacter campilacus]|uniref:Uncharacterized protein n=1 Tax=Polynucleobacter campilacus TaxID=1743163 RepID=A0A254PXN1_9BURK|nr:hypothetical protein CBI31_01975 [Polynucleobacter campilacus]
MGIQKIKFFRIHVDLKNPKTFPSGFVDHKALALVTESEILAHEKEDDLAWKSVITTAIKPNRT